MSKPYIVFCKDGPPCIVLATKKSEAIKMAKQQAVKDIDINCGKCDAQKAFEIKEYFNDCNKSVFYGWLKCEGDDHLDFTF